MKNHKQRIQPWKLSILATSMVITIIAFACQEQSLGEIEGNQMGEIYQVTEVSAKFPGGNTELANFMAANIKYPEEAKNNGVEGRVLVEFITNTDGSLSDVKVLKGIGFGCDAEAVRVIKGSPKWIPAEQKGVKVRQRMVLPVSFKLGPEATATNEMTQIREVNTGATFPGGLGKFAEYISANLEYPAEAKEKGVEGTVHVEFTVKEDGSIDNVKVLKGIGSGCDNEAVRVLKSSPKWQPNINEDGKAVATTLVLPVKFHIPE